MNLLKKSSPLSRASLRIIRKFLNALIQRLSPEMSPRILREALSRIHKVNPLWTRRFSHNNLLKDSMINPKIYQQIQQIDFINSSREFLCQGSLPYNVKKMINIYFFGNEQEFLLIIILEF